MEADSAEASRAQVEEFRRRHRIGLVTLFFTDMIGSTRLKQSLGDTRAIALIQRHHFTLRELLARFSEAEEIDTAGDSFFIVFAKPSDAVKFSLQLDSRLRAMALESKADVFDRIGIHVGEVFIDDAPAGKRSRDLFGLQVDTCARIMSLGGAHQILVSRFAFDSARQVLKGDEIEGVGSLSWLNHGAYSLKGVDEPVEICEVGEEATAPLSPPHDSEKARRHVVPGEESVLGWRPAPGQAVPNTKWILEKSLGEGGFGEVWVGRHETLKGQRVFKFCFNAERVRSLKREVTIFRLLKESVGLHPNIVAIEDVFFNEPPFYVVMEYVHGDNLRSWFETRMGTEAIALRDRLEIIAQIADALQAAHESGVIHRDIKPQNILIEQGNGSPRAKLSDFGIGKVLSAEVLSGMTRLGFTQTVDSAAQQSGTQMYMAPEIVAGRPATTLSDIYSLGVVLYQFLLGDFSRPLTTDWEEDIHDPFLRDDLRRCFARDHEKRFVAAKQLGNSLRSFSKRHAVLARRRLLAIGAICLFWVTLVLLLQLAPPLPFVSIIWSGERKFDDFLQRVGSKTPTRDDFVFLGIDPDSLKSSPPDSSNRALQLMTEHPFPWSREVWAILLDKLCGAGARLVIFDLVFEPPRDGDPAFAAALARYRNRVVLAANIDAANKNHFSFIHPNSTLIPPPAANDPRVGYVNFFPDQGYQPTRSIHLNLPDGYTISRTVLAPDPARSIHYLLTESELAGQAPTPNEKAFYALAARGLEQLGRGSDTPNDREAHVLRFSADDAYLPRPLYEVFDDKLWDANYRGGAFFKDKVVMVGASAQIFHDVFDTPLGERSGPKFHLEAMAAAMAHEFVRTTPLWVAFLLVAVAGSVAWALVGFVRHSLKALLLLFGIALCYLVATLAAYNWFGLLLVAVPVLTVLLLSGLCSLGYLILAKWPSPRRDG